MADEYRKNIVVGIRTDGEGVADKAALEIARLQQAIAHASTSLGTGTITSEEYAAAWRSLTSELRQWTGIADVANEAIGRLSDKQVQAARKAEEADQKRLNSALESSTKALDASERADVAEGERQARIIDRFLADQAKKDDAAEKAAIKEAERQARLVAAYEADQAKRDAAAEQASIREAERQAKLLADYEKDQARRDDAAEKAAIREAERQAKLIAAYLSDQAKKDAAIAHEMELRAEEDRQVAEHVARLEASERARDERRRRNKDADLNEGFESAKAQQQIKNLQDLANATDTLSEKYDALLTARRAAVASGDDAGFQRTQGQINNLIASLNKVGPEATFAAKGVDTLNATINAGAAYTRGADAAFRSHTAVVHAAADAHQEVTRASGNTGYAILNVAHAFQDLQYGVGAVLNNIPLVVQAFGGGAGLAGGIMIAAVALDVIAPKLEPLAREMGILGAKIDTTSATVKAFEQRIKELDGKSIKTSIDLQGADKAREDLEKLKQDISAYESERKSKTPVQEKVSKAVKEVISTEAGGTDEESGAKNLVNLITESRKELGQFYEGEQGVALKKLEDEAKKARVHAKAVKDAGVSFRGIVISEADAREAESKFEQKKNEYDKAKQEEISGMVGAALSGRERGIKFLEEEADTSKKFFASGFSNKGIKPVSPIFRQAITEARPETINAIDEEDAEAERQKGFEDTQKFIRGIQKEETTKADRQNKEADRLNNQGAANRIAQQQEEARKRDAEVNAAASKSVGPMDDTLVTEAFGMKAKGMPDAKIREDMKKRISGDIKDAGVGGEIANEADRAKFLDDVAEKMAASVMAKFQGKLAARISEMGGGEAIARTAPQPRGRKGRPAPPVIPAQIAAGELLDEQEEKDTRKEQAGERRDKGQQKKMSRQQIAAGMQREFGLTDEQAQFVAPHVESKMDRGMSSQAAGRSAFAELQKYIQHQQQLLMEMYSREEQMLNILGPATQQLGMMRANGARHQAMINQVGRGVQNGMFPMMPPR